MDAVFFAKLDANSIVLTPNKRLSTHLLTNYNQWQQHQGHDVWPTAQIFPLTTWLELLWQQLKQPQIILSTNQQLLLWQQVVSASTVNVIDVSATAKLAQQAWSYLGQWQKNLNDIQEFANLEVDVFTKWAKNYLKLCHTLHVIDPCQMLDQLIANHNQLIIPPQIYLVGFDNLAPQQLHFLTNLTSELTYISPTQCANAMVIGLADTHTEIKTFLRWAKTLNQEQPNAKIIGIIPNLEEIRTALVAQTQEIFFPAAIVNSEFEQNIINISGGEGLAQLEIIQSALLLLRLSPYHIHYETLSQLLKSPFVHATAIEATQCALLDAMLRDLNEPTLRWQTVINKIFEYQQQHKNNYGEPFINCIETYLATAKNLPKAANYAEWATHFLTLLTLFDWPGPRTLSSPEHQQVKRFYEVIEEFSQLKPSNEQLSHQRAQQDFFHLVSNTLFQTETQNGPIQILGLLEAAGLESDYIWVMGLDSTTWPANANPNPFIPTHLQRVWQMPHSSADRELSYAKQLQHRLMHSCKTLIFSYPKQLDEQELQCSTLLKNIPESSIEALSLSPYEPLTEQLQRLNTLQSFIDTHGPLLTQTEAIQGGAGIFKAQAACPFQAFATYRLKAEAITEPDNHLSYLDRGNLLHTTLENIWQTLGSQEKLCAISEENLLLHIKRGIDKAFTRVIPYYSEKLKPRLKQLEQQRLQQLMLNWFKLEKERPPFKIIAHEKMHYANFGYLQVRLKVDRIDELAPNQYLVIDYKSGSVTPKDWEGDRPKEPQLPLYCITTNNADAISFAEIKADSTVFKGIAHHDTGIPGIKTNVEWQELMTQWQKVLHQLADEFNQGLAMVTPQPNACDYCNLSSLCRINQEEICP